MRSFDSSRVPLPPHPPLLPRLRTDGRPAGLVAPGQVPDRHLVAPFLGPHWGQEEWVEEQEVAAVTAHGGDWS